MRLMFRPVRLTSQFAVLGAGAVILALGIVVPVLATTEAGPLLVTVTASPNPYAIAGSTSISKSTGVYGYGTNGETSGVIGVMGYVLGAQSMGVEGYSKSTSALSYGVYGYSAGSDGVRGQSPAGDGVVGITSVSTSSPYAGVVGDDTSTGSNNYGVGGESTNGIGVYGVTTSTVAPSTSGLTQAGVLGVDESTGRTKDENDGVQGTTAGVGYGVEGDSTGASASGSAGAGVGGIGGNGDGVYGSSDGGGGVVGFNGTVDSTPAPDTDEQVGVYGISSVGSGVYGFSQNRNGIVAQNDSPVYNALYAEADSATGTAFRAYNASTGANMAFDYHGNLTVTGNVIANGTTLSARLRNPSSDVMTYAAQSTESTVEDTGTAQLVNGTAAVALASDFRQTIDGSSPYMVIVTPYGETDGLYVAQRGAQGFVVRENHNGHSTVAFDYRIVARPYGAREARLPHYAAMVGHEASQGTGTPQVRFARGKNVAQRRMHLAMLAKRLPPTVAQIRVAPPRIPGH